MIRAVRWMVAQQVLGQPGRKEKNLVACYVHGDMGIYGDIMYDLYSWIMLDIQTCDKTTQR